MTDEKHLDAGNRHRIDRSGGHHRTRHGRSPFVDRGAVPHDGGCGGRLPTLQEVERGSALKIDGVVIASCDAEGKVHLGKVTDHSTKTGLKWGVVGGAIVGVIFPPSIIASAAALGAGGAVFGKVRNVFNRKGLADELADVMQPNTAGIIALVEDTAVVEIRKALDKADRIVEKAIDEQLAAEIDREAAAAKESLASDD